MKNLEREIQHNSSLKIQSIIILIVILFSLASAIYFYLELQRRNEELNQVVLELTHAKRVLEEKEAKIINIQDSVIGLLQKLDELNTDSAFLIKARDLIQKSNNITVNATASSYLPPSSYNTYYPANAVDGDPATPWVEGAKGYGVGEFLKIEFNKSSTIKGINIINGYNYSPDDAVGDRFSKNSRVKTAKLTFSDGTSEGITLEDSNKRQTIQFSERNTKFVLLTIEDTYAGTKWDDTCLSEIDFIFLIE